MFNDTPADKLGSTSLTHADFKLFLSLWNQRQNQTTPDLHFRIADWLEYAWEKGETNLLLMVFRAAGKSTITGLFCAWLLYKKRDLRILILAADQILAGKMVRNVKRIIERHPLCHGMKPSSADQWASDRFTVRRAIELRDPSMLARGIDANLTGSRADIIICDDVEVPNTSDTPTKRQDLREKLGEISFILTPGGMQIYIGTPHNYYSIYAKNARTEIGEEKTFLNGFKRLEIPVCNAQGQSAWPEKFNNYVLDKMLRQSGPNKFNSQMMLRPVNIGQGRLNPDLLHWHDQDIAYDTVLKTLQIAGHKMISASAFWDPAFGSASGDHSVLAIVYTDARGVHYAQHIKYITINPNSNEDEATQQCKIVADLLKEYMIPRVCVEINGIGRFLPGVLRNHLARINAPCAVQEISSRTNKEQRILEAFDAVLASRRLSLHRSVAHTPFIHEMREWQPSKNKGHDDGLDALAGALSQEPLRLERIYGQGRHMWMSV